jgi:hypothetical protein
LSTDIGGSTRLLQQLGADPCGKALSDQRRIWDVATGDELFALTGHAGAVIDLTISSDGPTLHTAGADRDMRAYPFDVDALIALAEARAARPLTQGECQIYLHLEACP